MHTKKILQLEKKFPVYGVDGLTPKQIMKLGIKDFAVSPVSKQEALDLNPAHLMMLIDQANTQFDADDGNLSAQELKKYLIEKSTKIGDKSPEFTSNVTALLMSATETGVDVVEKCKELRPKFEQVQAESSTPQTRKKTVADRIFKMITVQRILEND